MIELPVSLGGMLHLIEQRAPQSRIDLGLDRVLRVLDRLALRFPTTRIISIAGTNGKGSTVAFLEAVAARANLTTLALTSPHLVHFGERFRYKGEPLADDEIAGALRAVECARNDIPLTWFEHVMLAGFELAARRKPDWLLAEVGMGGRLDAVNALDADVAVITSIGLDHQRFLGRTRAAIAREKSGIARAGRPAVVAEKRLPKGMLETLESIGAGVQLAGRDFDWRWRAGTLAIRLGDRLISGISPGLAGRHQGGNAAAAVAAALSLDPALSDKQIREGVAGARLQGRFQRVTESPDVVLDVAHNPAAARVLAAQLERLPGEKVAVFAALEDKDIAGIVRPLAKSFKQWYVATLDVPRGLSAKNLVARMGALPVGGEPEALESVAEALAAARQTCTSAEQATARTIVVFGSFMTVAAALQTAIPSNLH